MQTTTTKTFARLREKAKTALQKACTGLLCHRALYAGLSASHVPGCIDYPAIYVPTVLLYSVMAIRG